MMQRSLSRNESLLQRLLQVEEIEKTSPPQRSLQVEGKIEETPPPQRLLQV